MSYRKFAGLGLAYGSFQFRLGGQDLRALLALGYLHRGLAMALGFSPVLIHYGLMTMVSITAVGAFDAVGSILVVALMITPPAAASSC